MSEFGDHNAPVTDVEFHPHEFLLASGSADGTVKFWDLETFSLVSSSAPDVPSVRSVSFNCTIVIYRFKLSTRFFMYIHKYVYVCLYGRLA